MTNTMLLKTVVICALIVTISSEDNVRVKRAKYFSYPTRFYRKPPSPHVVKEAFSYTPPPNYMQDDEPHYRPKVSKKPPPNEGLGDEDIGNLIKHLTKKDLDKIIEFAGVSRYADKYRDDSSEKFEYKLRRPENSGYRNEDIEQFAQNLRHFKDQEDMIKAEYNGPHSNHGPVRPRIIHPTSPTFPDDFDNNPNANYLNDASQTKVIYTNPTDSYNPKVVYSNEQHFSNTPPNPNTIFTSPSQFSSPLSVPPPIPSFYSQQGPFSNTPLDTEESMRQFVTYVTVPPNYYTNRENTLFTDSETMKEEQLPKPLNLRDDYEVANTDNVPKVVNSDGYKVESFKDLPLMNYRDSKLHTVSSYNVPHYVVTSTKSQSPPQTSSYHQVKVPTIEQAPAGYTGKDMSDAHLKAVKIWTHRSKGTAYTLHDDGTLSLEKPKKPQHTYGYSP